MNEVSKALRARQHRRGQQASKALLRAAKLLNAYTEACSSVGEGPKARDDSRITLSESLNEYGSWLASRHEGPVDRA